jgi:DNA-binding NtrC family response regulator
VAHILVVDDDRVTLHALCRIVSFCGHTPVAEVDSVTAANAYFLDSRILAVLTDYLMPRLDGLELLSIWQDVRPQVRRLLVTAAARTDVRDVSKTGAVQMVLIKPLSLADMKAALAWL